jgi:hypothetical protein
MNKVIKVFCLSILSGLFTLSCFSQISLSGPTCVIPGVIYQYKVTGNWDSTSTMQLCLSGGIIADSTDTNTCTPIGGAPLSAVLVIWSNNSSGSLTLTSTKGNASLSVSITQALAPGVIDSTTKIQSITYDSIPTTINCAVDVGGSCSPSYNDQWQQSVDMVTWIDIIGATGQNLNFSSPLTQSTLFRRKVTETVTGSIAYSDAAIVNVYAQLPLADSTDSSTGWLRREHNGDDYVKSVYRKKLHNCFKNFIETIDRSNKDFGILTKAQRVRRTGFPINKNYSEL